MIASVNQFFGLYIRIRPKRRARRPDIRPKLFINKINMRIPVTSGGFS